MITYREMTALDTPKVVQLNEDCLPENYCVFTWYELTNELNAGNHIALEGDVIVGYILLSRAYCDIWKDILGHAEPIVWSLVVHPDYRRQGIATALLRAALQKVESDRVHLHVRISNPAQELYKNLGFTVAGVESEYYSNPTEDGYHMIRKVA